MLTRGSPARTGEIAATASGLGLKAKLDPRREVQVGTCFPPVAERTDARTRWSVVTTDADGLRRTFVNSAAVKGLFD